MNNSKDVKVILSFNDNYVGIVLFNSVDNEVNRLYENIKPLSEKAIVNGYINKMKDVYECTEELICNASKFTKFKITHVYANFDNHEISFQPVKLEKIELQDKIFDLTIWEKIKSTINIDQIAHKHIYGVEYLSWSIDGKEYNNITNEKIAGQILEVKTLLYEVNKALYNQYINLFKKLNIQCISLKPFINDFANLSNSIKDNHHELFVYINDNALSISRTTGRRLMKTIYTQELGLNALYDELSKTIKQDVKYVKNIMNTTGAFGNNLSNLEIINGFNYNESSFVKIYGNNINEIMGLYAKAIVDCVKQNIEHLKNTKKINIAKTTYIPNNQLANKVINLTQLKNDSNVIIFNNEHIQEHGYNYIQHELLINTLKYENSSSKKIQCVQVLTNKDLKSLNKGE